MPEGNSISISVIGDLSKPATVLIEKIADATGGYFKPFQIKRVAKAEAEAEKIRALSKIETTELEQRALRRFIFEEKRKQETIENISEKAILLLAENAKPEKIGEDWMINFFDKCKLISDSEMQQIWARILSGEANLPGKYSKGTINLLASLDKDDVMLFTALCSYAWKIGDRTFPLVFDSEASIYNKRNINFGTLKHLDAVGLVSFDAFAGYKNRISKKIIKITYFDRPLFIDFGKDINNELQIGNVLLTRVGLELSDICNPGYDDGFFEYVFDKFTKQGLNVSKTKTLEEKVPIELK